MSAPVPISRVTRDGQVERLGQWLHDERVLELERAGFPFLGPGRHQLEGELPWIFWDMCPSGYLGRRLQAQTLELKLPPNPRDWMAKDVLLALTLAGADLAGNLLIGDESARSFSEGAINQIAFRQALDEALRASFLGSAPSSLGGERPKVLYESEEGAMLMKFSPPRTSPQGQRWTDLLRVEALCSSVLREVGIISARSRTRELFDRTTLLVFRFDRLKSRGRVGVGTLYWLAMERFGNVSLSAPEVMTRLYVDGLVDAAAVETCALVHAFSAAIGNNDAHLGNYALLFDDDGRATLAPIYDVLPMVLAPRNDELPDAWLKPQARTTVERIIPWVERLIAAVEADAEISPEFKRLWRRQISM